MQQPDGLSCLAEVAERILPATPHHDQKRRRTRAVRYTPPASPSARESREDARERREAYERREARRALATWRGAKRQWRHTFAQQLRFHDAPPFGVAAPAGAAAVLGNSLRCARGVLEGDELVALQAELGSMPRSLPWGKPDMLPSTRRFFDLDAAAIESVARGEDGVSRSALEADLALAPERRVCTPQLASRIALHMQLQCAAELRGIQANYQRTNFPEHKDETDGDGFGRDVATVNVRGNGRVFICEHWRDQLTHSWWFDLAPGDVWAMPGDDGDGGYVRWGCTHALPLTGAGTDEECRISLNIRCGL